MKDNKTFPVSEQHFKRLLASYDFDLATVDKEMEALRGKRLSILDEKNELLKLADESKPSGSDASKAALRNSGVPPHVLVAHSLPSNGYSKEWNRSDKALYVLQHVDEELNSREVADTLIQLDKLPKEEWSKFRKNISDKLNSLVTQGKAVRRKQPNGIYHFTKKATTSTLL